MIIVKGCDGGFFPAKWLGTALNFTASLSLGYEL